MPRNGASSVRRTVGREDSPRLPRGSQSGADRRSPSGRIRPGCRPPGPRSRPPGWRSRGSGPPSSTTRRQLEAGPLHGQEGVVEERAWSASTSMRRTRRSGSGRWRASAGSVSRSLAWTKPSTSSTPVADHEQAGVPGRAPRAPRPRRAWPCGAATRRRRAAPARVASPRSCRCSAPVRSWWATSSMSPSSRDAPSIDRELLGRRRGGQLVARLDAEQAGAGVGQPGEHAQQRAEHGDVEPVGQRPARGACARARRWRCSSAPSRR